jgi:hypothetical protein
MLYTETPAVTALADALSVPDGGFTVDLAGGERPTTGYVVSIFPDRTVVMPGPIVAADLIDYMNDHEDLLSVPGHLFGGWRDPDTEMIYLDVSVHMPARDRARALAMAYDQVAYFDLERGRSEVVAPIAF